MEKIMKCSRWIPLAALSLVAAQGAGADDRMNAGYFTDRAEVLSATPMYRQVNQPRQVCWTDAPVASDSSAGTDHNIAGALVGALAGGLLGNTVGQGNGRSAATAVGAVTGALVGDRVDAGLQQPPQPVQHCEMRNHYQQVLAGYNVTYRYRGHMLNMVLPQQPGRFIEVGVHVAPVAAAGGYPPPGPAYPPAGAGYPPPSGLPGYSAN